VQTAHSSDALAFALEAAYLSATADAFEIALRRCDGPGWLEVMNAAEDLRKASRECSRAQTRMNELRQALGARLEGLRVDPARGAEAAAWLDAGIAAAEVALDESQRKVELLTAAANRLKAQM